MKQVAVRRVAIALCLMLMLMGVMAVQSIVSTPQYVVAEELGDDLSDTEEYEDEGTFEGNLDADDEGVADFIGNYRGMTNGQLRLASRTLSPLTNLIGNVIGGIIVFASIGMFLMTAADLFYIAFPPIRPLLYPAGQQAQGGAMGGMGMGGYGMGGMRGGMMGGGATPQGKQRQLISDEAVQCAAMMGGGQQAQGGAMGAMGGMGMGMGGMGAMGGQQDTQANVKSVIGTYFKKRIVFMVLFAICVVVLLSSKLLGTGVNLASWILKLLDTLNSYMP